MARPAAGLGPKHWKALELWEEGVLSLKEIAAACGWSSDVLYDLFEGNPTKVGAVAHLFKAEVDKITTRTAQKVRTLVKDNKKLALLMLNNRLKELRKAPIDDESSQELTRILNSLAKATPTVEIGSYSLSMTKGLTAEELVYEFKRLSALARNASVGGGVPKAGEAGARRIPGLAEPGGTAPKE